MPQFYPLLICCCSTKKRNWLAHGYFSDRSIDFLSESRREMMVEELQEISEFLHSLDELFTQKTMEYVETYGITQELIDLEFNRLLADAGDP